MTEAEKERAAVVAFTRSVALSVGDASPMNDNMPLWRKYLWAIIHPRRWGEIYGGTMALVRTADAIERGDHLKGTGDE